MYYEFHNPVFRLVVLSGPVCNPQSILILNCYINILNYYINIIISKKAFTAHGNFTPGTTLAADVAINFQRESREVIQVNKSFTETQNTTIETFSLEVL